jgi:hypothetical protein
MKKEMNNMEHYKRTMPEAGEKWKHFKGHVYKTICIAGDTERDGLDVVYQDTQEPKLIWARPLRMFMSEVDHEKYPEVTWKWRFQKVADADE